MSKSRFPLKVLTVAQRKGGNCKTTTARYVSEWLARFGNLRVLTIDLDNQANISHLLLNMEGRGDHIRPPVHPEYDPQDPGNANWDGRVSSADLIKDAEGSTYKVTRPTAHANWDIMPADSQALYKLEREESETRTRGLSEVLKLNIGANFDEGKPDSDGRIDPDKAGFDVVVIDTGPSGNSLMRAAIHAATHVLVPFTPDGQSILGISEMVGLIRNEQMKRPGGTDSLEIVGLWPWRVRNVAVHDANLLKVSKNPQYASLMMPPQFNIPERILFQELDQSGPNPGSIFDVTDKKSKDVREQIIAACEHIYRKLFNEDPR